MQLQYIIFILAVFLNTNNTSYMTVLVMNVVLCVTYHIREITTPCVSYFKM